MSAGPQGTPQGTPNGTPRVAVSTLITTTSAAALVIASAGFDAFYAWHTGSHHGPVLGALSVLMALGLEGAKPFAIEGVFTSLRSWSPFRAVALALLGTVAIAYSLTAELSLIASIRADSVAQRTLAGDTAAAARARYDDANAELAALPAARPVGTIAAEIARLETTPGLSSCEDRTAPAYGPITRRICAEIATLRAEAEIAAQRERLRQARASAEHDMATALPTTKADPAATALATYLAAIGILVAVASLSDWLVLMPVLALEIGSALAAVLVSGTRHETAHRSLGTDARPEALDASPEAVPSVSAACLQDSIEAPSAMPGAAPVTGLKSALLEHLEAHGGNIRSGQRQLAKALGTSTTELHRTIHALAAAGVITLSTTPTGTELRLML